MLALNDAAADAIEWTDVAVPEAVVLSETALAVRLTEGTALVEQAATVSCFCFSFDVEAAFELHLGIPSSSGDPRLPPS